MSKVQHELEAAAGITPGDQFLQTIVQLKNGAVLQDIGERLTALVVAVRETAKAGALTITFKVVPTQGAAEVVLVDADIKERLPRPSLGKTLFFTTDTGALSRENPAQIAMNLQLSAEEQ